ncbi:GNAT family N-acetyltransferase [Actinomadura macrotermitis]|uniref:Putative ribosomal N-acetyltransferase YdaF n=1 Tax=Actinomadura macrotermitis TaxID=2585200 RepID=A0A7K0C2U8_9ACTN|nr:GNAT family protein [Actinomadura macrotermitis]MQY07432.1 putative ribosomal N-acetyltransferase YdaF [Actinomadura macrotermitis]
MFSLALGEGAELRPLEPWHAAEFAAHADRVRRILMPWIPWARTVVDEASAREYLQNYADRQARDEGRLYGIWVDGVLAGGVLFRVFNTALGVCEVGVWLDEAHQGRGLVTTAVRHMIDWAVRERGMARVEWRCDPRNAPSVATAKRLGFVHEGTLRSAFVMDGERRDEQVWALLADEWS